MTPLLPDQQVYVFPLRNNPSVGIVGVPINGVSNDIIPSGEQAIGTASSAYGSPPDLDVFTLRQDYSRLQAEHVRLQVSLERLETDFEHLLGDYERVRDILLDPDNAWQVDRPSIGSWDDPERTMWSCNCPVRHPFGVQVCAMCGFYRPSRPR